MTAVQEPTTGSTFPRTERADAVRLVTLPLFHIGGLMAYTSIALNLGGGRMKNLVGTGDFQGLHRLGSCCIRTDISNQRNIDAR